jgi:hypothetical protein
MATAGRSPGRVSAGIALSGLEAVTFAANRASTYRTVAVDTERTT